MSSGTILQRKMRGRSARRGLAAGALLFALGMQAADVRAELVFRSAEQVNGEQQWSAPRRYDTPADTAYPRTLADGTQIASEEVQVSLRGEISARDVYAAKVMESLIKRGRQRIAGNAVSFSGKGGDVDAAMEVGRLLRRLGVSTIVASEEQCLSSCVFAFMGGDQRRVEGRIGIHRPYFSSTRKVANRRSYYRQLQKRLQQYVEELDFPTSLYEALMAVPPESIRILSAADLRKYYLSGMSPAAEEEADAVAAKNLGISVLEYLQQKAQAQPCAGVFGGDGVCSGDAQSAARSGASATVPGGQQSVQNRPPVPDSMARKQNVDAEHPGQTLGASGAR
ncbi:MAG: hypothetical protein IH604_03865 [Burkholderiales bacterium]|nr:hypothetical protein [Burkholderiales bacterium]